MGGVDTSGDNAPSLPPHVHATTRAAAGRSTPMANHTSPRAHTARAATPRGNR